MKYDGYNGQIVIDGDALVISRDGMVARAAFGKGAEPRRIPLQAISAVALHEATRLKNGWISLGVGGAEAPDLGTGSAASNGDTVMFTNKHADEFSQLHTWLLTVVEKNQASGAIAAAPAGQTGRFDRLAAAAEASRDKMHAAADAGRAKVAEQRDAQAAAAAASGVLFTGMSHEEGRNSTVTLYADRLERVQERSRASLSRARQDTEVTPVRSITSVQAKKDGIRYTKVTAFASGNNIDFRFGHDEALRFKDALMKLVLAGGTPPAAAPAATSGSVGEQIRELAGLRDDGILTEDEFAAQKAKLLGG
jgi:hypothetical protein